MTEKGRCARTSSPYVTHNTHGMRSRHHYFPALASPRRHQDDIVCVFQSALNTMDDMRDRSLSFRQDTQYTLRARHILRYASMLMDPETDWCLAHDLRSLVTKRETSFANTDLCIFFLVSASLYPPVHTLYFMRRTLTLR